MLIPHDHRWRLAASLAEGLSLILAAILLFLPGIARAQVPQGTPAPEAQVVDENGVDLLSGMIDLSKKEISIGTPEEGLGRQLSFYSRDDSNRGTIQNKLPAGATTLYTYVTTGKISSVFLYNNGVYNNVDGSGSTLIYNSISNVFTFTDKNGSVYLFQGVSVPSEVMAWISSVTNPSGDRIDYYYDTINNVRRLQSVISSNGYGLYYKYSANFDLSRISAINLNRQYCAPAPADCVPGGADQGRSFTYSVTSSSTTSGNLATGQLTTVYSNSNNTSSLNRSTLYSIRTDITTYSQAGFSQTLSQGRLVVTRPRGGVSTYVFGQSDTNNPGTADISNRIISVNDRGLTWNYTWFFTGLQHAVVNRVDVALPGGGTRSAQIAYATPWTRRVTSQTFYFAPTSSRTTSYAYDSFGRLTQITNPEGDYVTYIYDDRGNITSTTHYPKPGSGLSPLTTTNGFPATCSNPVICNKPSYVIDPKGNRTDYTYDPVHGGVLTETLPADASGVRPQKRYTYHQLTPTLMNSSGQLVAGTPTWKLVGISSCAKQASCTGTADETVASYQYDANLQQIASTNAVGDGSAASRSMSRTFDGIGNAVALDGPRAGSVDTTRLVYDADRELVAKVSADPDGAGPLGVMVTRSTFDVDGNETLVETGSASDQSDSALAAMTVDHAVLRSFDLFNRKTSEATTSNGVTYDLSQLSYDAAGRLECSAVRMNPAVFSSLSSTSACALGTTGAFGDDRITRTVYDAAGETLKIQKAIGTPLQQDYVTYTYTPNGKQATIKDADGNVTFYTFDGFDRIAAVAFPSKTAIGSSAPCTIGAIAETTEAFLFPGGTINVPVVGPSETRTAGDDCEKYAYDRDGNRAKLIKRDGSVIRYTYDNLNRMAIKDIPGGSSSDVYFAYDLRGLQISAYFASPTGVGITNAYDAFGELRSTTSNMGTTIRSLGYQYDVDGNRTQLTYPDASYFTYEYDGLNNLKTVREAGTTAIISSTFDGLGRLVSQTRGAVTTTFGYDQISRPGTWSDDLAGAASDVTSTFSYNPANQVMTRSRSNNAYAFPGYVNVSRTYVVNGLNQYTTGGTATFTYDDNGNLIGDGSNTYIYDIENRMKSATIAGVGAVTLNYDPLGRLWQVVTPVKTLEYTSDGDSIIMLLNGANPVRFVHGPGDDDPMIQYDGTGYAARYSLQTDYQGSIVSAADATGAKYAINSYDEYGIGPTSNFGLFQYTGQAWIAQLGLYYYKARMYSPTLGRFMQTDPIGYKDQYNLYAYVGNDPVNGRDPTGTRVNMNLFDPHNSAADFRLWEKAESAQIDGIYTIMGHMGGRGMAYLSTTVRLTPEQLEGFAENSFGYKKGTITFLMTCFAGMAVTPEMNRYTGYRITPGYMREYSKYSHSDVIGGQGLISWSYDKNSGALYGVNVSGDNGAASATSKFLLVSASGKPEMVLGNAVKIEKGQLVFGDMNKDKTRFEAKFWCTSNGCHQ